MMRINKLFFLTVFILLGICKNTFAQTEILPESKVLEYISKYRDFAIYEQIRVGIPASVTLAQGILESGAGTSELTTQANNHFGIKCKNNWTGETMLHDDETKNECFRKYTTDKESYTDHSNYIRNNRRYSFLFDIPVNNYDEWAVGLRKAGYATNPKYSVRIINLIVKYNLQAYTTEASIAQKATSAEAELGMSEGYNPEKTEAIQLTKTERKKLARQKELQEKKDLEAQNKLDEAAEKAKDLTKETPQENKRAEKPKLETLNGLEGFYATKGTNLIYEADMRGLKPSKLIDYNELEDAIVPMDMFIYAEKKMRKAATKKVHIVQEGEDMYMIAQKEGMQLRSILAFNKLGSGEEPVVGARIYLQEQVSRRPNIINNNKSEMAAEAKQMEIPVITEMLQEAKRETAVNEAPVQAIENKIEVTTKINSSEEAAKLVKEAAAEEVRQANETQVIDATKEIPEVATIEPAKIITEQINPQDVANNVQGMLNNVAEPEPVKIIEEVVLKEPVREVAQTTITEKTMDASLTNAIESAKANTIETKIIPVEIKAQEIIVPVILPKSPSTYAETNVSPELRRMKRIMDDVVYAAPIVKAPKVIVPKPVVPKTVVPKPVTPKPTTKAITPKPVVTAVKDSVIKKVTPKKTIVVPTKTISPKATVPNKNTTPIATEIKKPVVKTVATKPAIAKPSIAKPELKTNLKTTIKADAKADNKTTIKTTIKTPTKKVDVKADTKTEVKKDVKKDAKKEVKKEIKPTNIKPAEKPKSK